MTAEPLTTAAKVTDRATAGFDLISEPWIRCHALDGRVVDLSLIELVEQAHTLRGIVGEVPTQAFAITRLVLAILHRAVEGPRDLRHWAALWSARELPADDVSDYLGEFADRFDLLHPVRPFYQVADLRTASGEVSGLEKLMADVPNGEPLFTTRLGSGIRTIPTAEAARWLVHCQAFDPSGIKSGAVGDPRVKGGKGYPIGTGWCGYLGGVLVEGRNLRETLLLNLVAEDRDYLPAVGGDVPVWERPPQTACEEIEGGRPPAGPLDLYTWQSRRIRLLGDRLGIHGVLICNGDRITPQNLHRNEPATAWRRSQTQEKKLGQPLVYMPLTHVPEKAFWRSLPAMLPSTAGRHQGSHGAATLAPGILTWIGELRDEGVLPPDYALRSRAMGVSYGNQSSTIAEIIDDALSMSAAVLQERSPELGLVATSAVRAADDGVGALRQLAGNLAQAGAGDPGGPEARAMETAYAALDAPFRRWVAELRPGAEPVLAQERWQRTANQLIRDLGAELVEQAGPAAWAGCEVKGRLVNTPLADLWFRSRLRQVFAMAYSSDTKKGTA